MWSKYFLFVKFHLVIYVVKADDISSPANVLSIKSRSGLYNNYFQHYMPGSYFPEPKFSTFTPYYRPNQANLKDNFKFTTIAPTYAIPNFTKLHIETNFGTKKNLSDIQYGYVKEYNENKHKEIDNDNKATVDFESDTIAVSGITCEDSEDGYFRAQVQWKNYHHNISLVLDEVTPRQLNSEKCKLELNQLATEINVDIKSSSFDTCGVKECTEDYSDRYLCLRLRFPTIAKLKLPEDMTLTLRCRVQEQMVTHTQQLGLSVNVDTALPRKYDRNNKIATGGATNLIKCQLQAFRRSSEGQFSRPLINGDIVSFGEELLLHVLIHHENEWRWSRMAEVWLSSGNNSESIRIPLLTAEGCTISEVRAVCPFQPRRLGPFAHSLLIRAPMFLESISKTTLESSVHLNVRVLVCRNERLCATRCSRSSRILQDTNSTLNQKSNTNVSEYPLNNSGPRMNKTPADKSLKYLSDVGSNVFSKESIQKPYLFEASVRDVHDNVHFEQVMGFPNGSNYLNRPRRDTSEATSTGNVAVLTFIVAQNGSQVTAPKAVTNEMAVYFIVGMSIIILILVLTISCALNNIYKRTLEKKKLESLNVFV